jgi:hypothetical protein
LLVDGAERKVCVLDIETLKVVGEVAELEGETIRCAVSVCDNEKQEHHVFVGCTSGLLLRVDPVSFFVTMRIKLNKHIFCMLQMDDDTLLCGQLQGYLDLVRISDGEVLLSEKLKHKTGNIISMVKSKSRPNEVTLATQKGIFFATIKRGSSIQ